MAISAINSLNFNRVAFKGGSAKPENKAVKKDENFFEENKEVILGLSAVGAAALAALALHKTGALNKITGKASQKAETAAPAIAGKVEIDNRAFDGAIGEKSIKKIQNAVDIADMEKTMAEFAPEGSRHAARIESKYEEALPEIFAEDAEVFSREEVLNYAKVAGLLK